MTIAAENSFPADTSMGQLNQQGKQILQTRESSRSGLTGPEDAANSLSMCILLIVTAISNMSAIRLITDKSVV